MEKGECVCECAVVVSGHSLLLGVLQVDTHLGDQGCGQVLHYVPHHSDGLAGPANEWLLCEICNAQARTRTITGTWR